MKCYRTNDHGDEDRNGNHLEFYKEYDCCDTVDDDTEENNNQITQDDYDSIGQQVLDIFETNPNFDLKVAIRYNEPEVYHDYTFLEFIQFQKLEQKVYQLNMKYLHNIFPDIELINTKSAKIHH
jgi:hypothetical protein